MTRIGSVLWCVLLVPVSAAAQTSPVPPPAQAVVPDEKATMYKACTNHDVIEPPTLDGARNRLECWQQMVIASMGDAQVFEKHREAKDNFESIAKADSLRRSRDSSSVAANDRLAKLDDAIRGKRLDDAQNLADDWERAQPGNPLARQRADRIRDLRAKERTVRTLYAIGAGLLVVVVALGVLAKKLNSRFKEKSAQRKQAAAERKAMLKVIDGVGRGKLYSMENSVFRIGAAVSEKSDEHNDLVISDSDASVSRFHCSLVRRDGHFYLVDSSLNGTMVNDELLERGEDRVLADGDELTIAGVSKIKFLLM